jgi:taurine dioxygenase
MRSHIDGLRAVHDFIPGFDRFADPSVLARWQEKFPPVEHPVVRTHPETGRRTLFVNQAFTTHVVGMDRAESDQLLHYLFTQAHVPEYQVRFRWSRNAVALWDNRATQHYAVNDYAPHPRVAERVAIVGDRPF